MPLSFVYLAGSVRASGFNAEIYDAMSLQHTLDDIEQRFRNLQAEYIGISAITSSISASLDVLRLVKILKPGIITILGGVHPTFSYDELLHNHNDIIDYIICGEGEQSLPALLTALENGHSPDAVPGIAFYADNRVVKTPAQPFVTDLDLLPTAWDLVDWNNYSYYVIPDSRLGAISTSRGCTHACTFCSQQKSSLKLDPMG